MLRRWKYPKDYLDIFWGALGYQPTHKLGFVFGIVSCC